MRFRLLLIPLLLILGMVPTLAGPTIPGTVKILNAADKSGSVGDADDNLMRQGLASSYENPSVIAAILGAPGGGIWTAYAEWSGNGETAILIPWTWIGSSLDAQAYANAIRNTPREFAGNTWIQQSIGTLSQYFATLELAKSLGSTWVMDTIGDGADNGGFACGVGRNLALANGVDRINGLYIEGEPGLGNYYNSCVIGGASSFALATTFNSFALAMAAKTPADVTGDPPGDPGNGSGTKVPEPASLAIFGLGLAGLAFVRRRHVANNNAQRQAAAA